MATTYPFTSVAQQKLYVRRNRFLGYPFLGSNEAKAVSSSKARCMNSIKSKPGTKDARESHLSYLVPVLG